MFCRIQPGDDQRVGLVSMSSGGRANQCSIFSINRFGVHRTLVVVQRLRDVSLHLSRAVRACAPTQPVG